MITTKYSRNERDGLNGLVKSSLKKTSTTEFDRDGKSSNGAGIRHGRVERKYVYDQVGRLIRISGSNGDWVDEFRYDERGRKTRIRTVPSRAERGRHAFGIGAAFDAMVEGETLEDGGTVETTYYDYDHDHPVEARVLDNEGMVLSRITYTYDADGRLSQEKLTTENVRLPKEFLTHIPVEHRAATIEQMKTQLAEISQRTGLSGDAERSYVYDHAGNMVERHMRKGSIREDIVWKYNQLGDAIEWTRTAGGFPHPTGEISEPALQCACTYEYDEHGNWIGRNEASEVGGTKTTRSHVRQLTYYR
jgi:hypothetical protein